jgi:hypothetical protein
MEDPRGRMSFTLADDLPLDLGYSPAIESLASGTLGVHIVGLTYVVN